MDVVERRFELEGGTLTLTLESEGRLDERDREEIERIAAQCQRYADRHSPARAADTAIEELGGQQGLTAG